MAKLVDVYRNDKQTLGRRQLPLVVDGHLTMVMDLNSVDFMYDNQTVKGKEMEEFMEKYRILSEEGVREAFQVTCKDILAVLGQTIPCVGCRRSVERLVNQLIKSGHPALDPLVITAEGVLTVRKDYFAWPHLLCTLLHGHSSTRLNDLVESQSRSKKSRRCLLHSLDTQRTRPMTTSWREVWSVMRPQCRDEVVLIEASTLATILESYLRKHRFCGECRTKVLRAYTLLMEDPEPCKEKGYVAGLYAGIRRCLPDKHIHLQTKTEYIANLISRAEPELIGSRRERHAKTLEIAQEEVLTCLGICVYERLHRIQLRLKEEECTCQVLAAIAIDGLCRNFEVAVELKRGKSQLELLFEELTKEEQMKQQRREHKKLRRKKRKERKAGQEEKENCDCELDEPNEPFCVHLDDECTCFTDKLDTQQVDRQKLQVLHRKTKGTAVCTCCDCRVRKGKTAGQQTNAQNGSKRNATSGSKQPQQQTRDKKMTTKRGAARTGSTPTGSNARTHTTTTNSSKKTECDEDDGDCDDDDEEEEEEEEEEADVGDDDSFGEHENNNSIVTAVSKEKYNSLKTNSLSPCQSCVNAQELAVKNHKPCTWSPHEQSQDCGYSSENNTCVSNPSSPDGSEVACSEGFCNHEGDCHSETGTKEHKVAPALRQNGTVALTLQQMLEESCSSEGEESCIPAEVVQEFKMKYCLVKEKRRELREKLRHNFAELCTSYPHTNRL